MRLQHIPFVSLLCVLLTFKGVYSQPSSPFLPDDNTTGLWHLDSSEPESLWTVTFGEAGRDRCENAIHSRDGNYLLCGSAQPGINQNQDFLAIKMNQDGEILWSTFCGEDGSDICKGIAQFPNGNIVIAGSIATPIRNDRDMGYYLLNSEGEQIRFGTFGTDNFLDNCTGVEIYDENHFILYGYTQSFDADTTDFWAVKVNQQGEEIWSDIFGTRRADLCKAGIMNRDGSLILAGNTLSREAPSSVFITSISGNGRLEWERTIEVDTNFVLTSIIEYENGYILAGNTLLWHERQLGVGFEIYVLSDEGEFIENMNYLDDLPRGEFRILSIKRTLDRGYALVGSVFRVPASNDICFVKLDSDLAYEYAVTYGGRNFDAAHAVLQDPDRNFTIFGYTNDLGVNEDEFLAMRIRAFAVPELDLSRFQHVGELVNHTAVGEGLWGEALHLEAPRSGCLSISDYYPFRAPAFTVEAWFRMNPDYPHSGTILCKRVRNDIFSYQLNASNTTDYIGFNLTDNSENHHIHRIRYDTDPADGQWHYIAAAYDGQYMSLFWDGVLVAHRWVGLSVFYGEGPLLIGADTRADGSDLQFFGLIDEVRISNSVRGYLGINEAPAEIPTATSLLYPASPNPFNSQTRISFSLPAIQNIQLKVFDHGGRLIRNLAAGQYGVGDHSITWDAQGVPGGTYFISLQSASEFSVVKSVVLK